MQRNEAFRAANPGESESSAEAELLPPYRQSMAPRVNFGMLNHPATFILIGFVGGIWFSDWMKGKRRD